MSRLAMDVIGSQKDFSKDPSFIERHGQQGLLWAGLFPSRIRTVHDARDGGRDAASTASSSPQVNLKFIWDVVSQIKVGERGQAYVVDAQAA